AWTEFMPDATRPPAREAASDGLDTSRHRLVVFGGSSDRGYLNDTLVLGLDAIPVWSPLATQCASPPARYLHAPAWDPPRDQLVVFGGTGDFSQHPFGDLWELSFAGSPAWSPITSAGPVPAARMRSQLVYDSARDRFLLLFGDDGQLQLFNDVWELRLGPVPAWRQLSPDGTPPTARNGAMCVYDAARDRVLVFGGRTSSSTVNDLWALNLGSGDGAWQQLPLPPGPTARYLGLLRLDTTHDRVLLFGGQEGSNNVLNDTWALDLGGTPAWRQLSP